MIPRHGDPPRSGRRYRLRPGAYAILLDGTGHVLLTEQATADGPDLQLPGGGLDPGESPLPALTREIREETGHRARLIRRIGAHRTYVWMGEYGVHGEKLCTIYLGRPGPRLGPPGEAGHRAVRLPLLAAVAALGSPGDAAMLARLAGAAGLRALRSRR